MSLVHQEDHINFRKFYPRDKCDVVKLLHIVARTVTLQNDVCIATTK